MRKQIWEHALTWSNLVTQSLFYEQCDSVSQNTWQIESVCLFRSLEEIRVMKTATKQKWHESRHMGGGSKANKEEATENVETRGEK